MHVCCMPNEADMPASAHTSCYHMAPQFVGCLVLGLYGQQTPPACKHIYMCVCVLETFLFSVHTFLSHTLFGSSSDQNNFTSSISAALFSSLLSHWLSHFCYSFVVLLFLPKSSSCTCLPLSLHRSSSTCMPIVLLLVYYYAVLP